MYKNIIISATYNNTWSVIPGGRSRPLADYNRHQRTHCARLNAVFREQ